MNGGLLMQELLQKLKRAQEARDQFQNRLDAYNVKFNKIDHNLKSIHQKQNAFQKRMNLLNSPEYFKQQKSKYNAKLILGFSILASLTLALSALWYYFFLQTYLIRVIACTFIAPFLASSLAIDALFAIRYDTIRKWLFDADNKAEIRNLKEQLGNLRDKESHLMAYQESLIPNYEYLRTQWQVEENRVKYYGQLSKDWEMTHIDNSLNLESSEPTIIETRKGR